MDPKELNFSLLHIGINTTGAEEGYAIANTLVDLFGFPMRDGNSSIFVNDQFEVMKKPFRGKLGHIAISTSDIVKAKAYLESKGIAFAEETAGYDADGKLKVIYTVDDIAGFAFHLTQKG